MDKRKGQIIKMKIAIDLDGVVVNYQQKLVDEVNRIYDKNLTLEDMTDYNFKNFKWINNDDLWKIIIKQWNDGTFRDCEPIEGALKGLRTLYRHGHTLQIITYRMLGAKLDTITWLDKHDVKYDTISFEKNKGLLCRKLGVEIMIDDSPDVLIDCKNYGVKSVCYNQPWNSKFTPTWLTKNNRVSSWDSLIKYLS